MVTELLLIALAYIGASWLLSATESWTFLPPAALGDLIILAASGAVATMVLRRRSRPVTSSPTQTITTAALTALAFTVAGAVLAPVVAAAATPPHVFVVTGLIFLILSATHRLVLRQRERDCTKVLIYGAGRTGQKFLATLTARDGLRPVAFVDDDTQLQESRIGGLDVYAPDKIADLAAQHHVSRIVLAMPRASAAVQSRIIRNLSRLDCEIHTLSAYTEPADVQGTRAKPVDLHALMGRDRLEEDLPGVSDTYHSRSILVTGAGGSIGSEICRQLMACNPERLVLMDHSELMLFEIDRELRHMGGDVDIQPVLGSVCERDLVTGVMAKYKVDTVLHAAAYKHVPMVEYNALEGMRNNVLGTKVVADAARDAGVERFILVSTDKAVRPSSIMGASKRFAELLIQDMATRSTTTRFAMVRFGNVLGSSGSVIPLFREQIARGGPVTLTHNDITRYFMTIPEAVQLVLLAGTFSRGGDVFVLDMGKPVPIRDVARKLIESAGLSVRDTTNPKGDIEIKITGLRPGEKMHEELLIGSDMLTTPHKRILRAQEDHLSEIEMANALNALKQAIETRDPKLMNETLSKWIERADKAKPVIVNE